MMQDTQILNGKALAQRMQADLATEVEQLQAQHGRAPGLGVLLVGDDAASQVYVRHKERAAQRCGLHAVVQRLPKEIDEAGLLAAIEAMNQDAALDAFMLQLPLPAGLDAARIVEAIHPLKDADGLHPVNIGKLVLEQPAPQPCTPAGIMALLAETKIDLSGKHAVVIGRSAIVGKPMAHLLLGAHATVTLCHSRTRNVAELCRAADVVVAAVGRPRMVQRDWVKAGALVIDVGINRIDNKLVGDVDYDALLGHAGAMTPVPGGVGPMTVTMLLRNAVRAARLTLAHG